MDEIQADSCPTTETQVKLNSPAPNRSNQSSPVKGTRPLTKT